MSPSGERSDAPLSPLDSHWPCVRGATIAIGREAPYSFHRMTRHPMLITSVPRLALLFLFLLPACASRVKDVSTKRDLKLNVFVIECGFLDACRSEARRLCPSGYDTLSEDSGSSTRVDPETGKTPAAAPRQEPSWWFARPESRLRVRCR